LLYRDTRRKSESGKGNEANLLEGKAPERTIQGEPLFSSVGKKEGMEISQQQRGTNRGGLRREGREFVAVRPSRDRNRARRNLKEQFKTELPISAGGERFSMISLKKAAFSHRQRRKKMQVKESGKRGSDEGGIVKKNRGTPYHRLHPT